MDRRSRSHVARGTGGHLRYARRVPVAALADDVVATIDAYFDRPAESSDSPDVWARAATDRVNLTRAGFPDHFTASALPVTVDGAQVCLVLHKRMGLWVQPGGHLEQGDRSLAEAAGREMGEETGLVGTVLPPPLLLSRHAAPCREGAWHLDFQFMALTAHTDLAASDEAHEVAWFPPDQLPAGLAPGVDALVAAARDRFSRSALGESTPLRE